MKTQYIAGEDMAGTQAAMIRAARRVRELARFHHQPLALMRDGKVVFVMPDDLPPLPGDPAPDADHESIPSSPRGKASIIQGKD